MPQYRYTGRGTMSFHIDGIDYTVSKELPNREFVDLPHEVTIDGLELVEEKEKKNGGKIRWHLAMDGRKRA